MASNGDIYLGVLGSEVLITPLSRELTIADAELSRQGRTASGLYRKEVLKKKKKITLNYGLIDGDELEKILDVYTAQQTLCTSMSLLIYKKDTHDPYTVFIEAIERTRVLSQGVGLWGDVKIELNEV
jgi:hypothetical protein